MAVTCPQRMYGKSTALLGCALVLLGSVILWHVGLTWPAVVIEVAGIAFYLIIVAAVALRL